MGPLGLWLLSRGWVKRPPYCERTFSLLGGCPTVFQASVPDRKESTTCHESGLSFCIFASGGASHPNPRMDVRLPAPWQYGSTRVLSFGRKKDMDADVTATVPSLVPASGPNPPALPMMPTVSTPRRSSWFWFQVARSNRNWLPGTSSRNCMSGRKSAIGEGIRAPKFGVAMDTHFRTLVSAGGLKTPNAGCLPERYERTISPPML